jgi:hypothetical protein
VVDVRAAPGDESVVQDHHLIIEVLRQKLRHPLLTAGAARPHGLVTWVSAERESQAAKAWVLVSDTLLTIGAPTVVLTARACARGSAVDVGWLWGAHP